MANHSEEQRTMRIYSSLPLLAISEKGVMDKKFRDINLRLKQIDKSIIELESERADLYLNKAKLLEEVDKMQEEQNDRD